MAGPSPATQVRESADLIIADDDTEQALLEYLVPHHIVTGDNGLRFTMDHWRQSSAGVLVTYTYRFYYGTTLLWTEAPTIADFDTDIRYNHTVVELMAKDADDAQELYGLAGINITSGVYATCAEDATTELTFKITVQMSVADPDAQAGRFRYLIENL